MNLSICQAINERLLIRFTYNNSSRIVEPFSYGLTAAGHEVLRGYQIGGESGSGQPLGWRLFTVRKVEDLSLTADHWESNPPDYRFDDPAIVSYFARVTAESSDRFSQAGQDSDAPSEGRSRRADIG